MIGTKGRYGLRVMIDLAEHYGEERTPLKDIAARQGISKKYLEIIVRELVTANLVIGISGKGGGYRLCRKPEEIPVGEIIEALERTLATVSCLDSSAVPCPQAASCPTLPLWEEYDRLTRNFFYGKLLSDLISPLHSHEKVAFSQES